MKLESAITEAIREFGIDIITEPRFVNILMDYGAFREEPSLRFIFRIWMNDGFFVKLKKDATKIIESNQFIKIISDSMSCYPFEHGKLRYCLWALLWAIRNANRYSLNTIINFAPDKNRKVTNSFYINRFFPVDGIILGVTRMEHLLMMSGVGAMSQRKERVYYSASGIACYSSDNKIIDEIVIRNVLNRPKHPWFKRVGMDVSWSFTSWCTFFRELEFTLSFESPIRYLSKCGRDYLSATIVAESPDKSLVFILDFHSGNNNEEGCGLDSKNSLWSISCKANANIVKSNVSFNKYVDSQICLDFNKIFPNENIILGKTKVDDKMMRRGEVYVDEIHYRPLGFIDNQIFYFSENDMVVYSCYLYVGDVKKKDANIIGVPGCLLYSFNEWCEILEGNLFVIQEIKPMYYDDIFSTYMTDIITVSPFHQLRLILRFNCFDIDDMEKNKSQSSTLHSISIFVET